MQVVGPKISIKAKVNEKSADDHIISQIEKPHELFDKELLKKTLEVYIGEQVKLNRKSWAYTIKPDDAVIKEDTVIFMIDNSPQEIEFNKNKEEFTQYLRDKLNNQFIAIQTEKREIEEMTAKTIDPVQKFENMVKENPVLLELKNTFHLDL